MTSHRDALRVLADALPAGAAVPVPREWLLELLDGAVASDLAPPALADLTCREVAGLLSRSDSTVRGWLDAGVLEGYRMRGREWRIPRAALARFQETEANRRPERSPSSTRRGKPADLSAWRHAS